MLHGHEVNPTWQLFTPAWHDFVFVLFCWFFGPVDARQTCFGPCVVAAAYAAVVDTAIYTGMRWLICTAD